MGYNYNKYYGRSQHGYSYIKGIRDLKKLNNISSIRNYLNNISIEKDKLREVLNSNQNIVDKISQIEREIEKHNSKIKGIKDNPENRRLLGLMVKENIKDDIKDLNENLRSLYKSKSSFESQMTVKMNDYISTYKEYKDLLDLSMKISDKLRILENKQNKLHELKANAASNIKKTRSVGWSLRKQISLTEYCPYCHCNIGSDPHLEHIYPVSKGGKSSIKNMIYICQECNIKKSNLTLRQFVKKYNLNWELIEISLDKLGKDF